MSNFCGSNLHGQTMASYATYNQRRPKPPANSAFSGNPTLSRSSATPSHTERVNIFKGALIPAYQESIPVWGLETVEETPVSIWQDARVDYLETMKPRQKADRSLAPGLKPEFLRGGQDRPSNAFLATSADVRAGNASGPVLKNALPCPHFLAEA